jgi:uncharacterized protein YkwD
MDYIVKEDLVEYAFDKIKYLTLPSESNNFKSKFLESNILLYCVVLLLFLKIITVSAPINFPKNIFFTDITKIALENFANQTRQSAGLQPLAESQKLDEAAEMKAQNMVQNNYFAHISPTGISPWYWFSQAGYNYKYAGENLAIGFFDSEEVYQAWLNSPEHKANILNPNYKEFGTAVLSGFGQGKTIVVVQEFGQSQLAPEVTVKNNNSKPVAVQQNPAPAASQPVAEIPSTSVPKVLSQSTVVQNAIQPATSGSSNFYAETANSILYNYNGILQDIIYGVSSIVIAVLLAMILISFNFNFRRQLVFRSVVIVVLLSVATLLNREMIISIIPHQVII